MVTHFGVPFCPTRSIPPPAPGKSYWIKFYENNKHRIIILFVYSFGCFPWFRLGWGPCRGGRRFAVRSEETTVSSARVAALVVCCCWRSLIFRWGLLFAIFSSECYAMLWTFWRIIELAENVETLDSLLITVLLLVHPAQTELVNKLRRKFDFLICQNVMVDFMSIWRGERSTMEDRFCN